MLRLAWSPGVKCGERPRQIRGTIRIHYISILYEVQISHTNSKRVLDFLSELFSTHPEPASAAYRKCGLFDSKRKNFIHWLERLSRYPRIKRVNSTNLVGGWRTSVNPLNWWTDAVSDGPPGQRNQTTFRHVTILIINTSSVMYTLLCYENSWRFESACIDWSLDFPVRLSYGIQ